MDNKIDLSRGLGVRVHDARMALGISQAELARRVGLSRSAICKIENGDNTTPINRIKKIASALDVDPMFLLLGAKSETPRDLSNSQKIVIEYVTRADPSRVALLLQYIDLLEGGGR